MKSVTFSVLLTSFILTFFSARVFSATVDIDTSVTHQTMTGWEVTGRMWQFDKENDRFNPEWERYSDQILDKLVNELGINRFRLEVLSGGENPIDYWQQFTSGRIGYSEMREHFYEKLNDNTDPTQTDVNGFQFSYLDYLVENMLLPMREKVQANGESLYINLTYVDFRWTNLRGNIEHANSPDEYAEFVLASFEHLKTKYGIIPNAFEVILEADNTTHWTGENIGRGLLAVKSRLNAAGYNPEFIAPSTANAERAVGYLNSMMTVEGVSEALDVMSYHRYDSVVRESNIRDIANTAQLSGLRTEMLEHVGADINELFQDLAIGNVSAWQQYGIATNLLGDLGGYYYKVNAADPDNPDIYLDGRSAVFPAIFRHVRQGAVRIGSTADTASLKTLAFRNLDGKIVTAILTSSPQQIDLRGLPDGEYMKSSLSLDGAQIQLTAANVESGLLQGIELPQGLTVLYSGNMSEFENHNSGSAQSPGVASATAQDGGDSGGGSIMPISVVVLGFTAVFFHLIRLISVKH